MSEEMTARTALRDHQRQIDMDGVEVGVSRQALDEVLGELQQQDATIARLEAAIRTEIAYHEGTESHYRAEQLKQALQQQEQSHREWSYGSGPNSLSPTGEQQ